MFDQSGVLCVAAEILTEAQRGYKRDLILSNIDLNDHALFVCGCGINTLRGSGAMSRRVLDGLAVAEHLLVGLLVGEEPPCVLESIYGDRDES